MTTQIEKLTFAVYCLENDLDIGLSASYASYLEFRGIAADGHHGDCTGECCPCCRCQLNQYEIQAARMQRLLSELPAVADHIADASKMVPDA